MIEQLIYSTISVNDSLDTISQIGKNTFDTAENTKFGIIASITFCVSIATFIVSVLTYYAQRETQRNTARLSKKQQKSIILDIVGHFYESFVIIIAILYKMRICNFEYYPSEIYFEEMKIEANDISKSFFANTKENSFMDALVFLRNLNKINLSIDVCVNHIRNPYIDKSTKDLDIMQLIGEIGKCFIFLNSLYNIIICEKDISSSSKTSILFNDIIKKKAKNTKYKYNSEYKFDFSELQKELGIHNLFVALYADRAQITSDVNYYLGKLDNGEDIIHMIKIIR